MAHAREHFGEQVFPWDARGEVYVRYGRPDHISSSANIRFETDPGVLAVKDRLMNQAGEALAPLLLSRRMVSFFGSEIGMDDEKTLSTILGYPVYPVRGVWEYWIYTNLGIGVEVTFVQEYTPGPYNYAVMPQVNAPVWVDEITGQAVTEMLGTESACIEFENPSADTQTKSNLDLATDESRYRDASRGAQNAGGVRAGFRRLPSISIVTRPDSRQTTVRSNLEVYFGIPTRDLNYVEGADGRLTAYLKRGRGAVRRGQQAGVSVKLRKWSYTRRDRWIPPRLAFCTRDGPSFCGARQLSAVVQILDTSSDKSQVYNREVVLSPFGDDSLRVSDIEMAALIRPSRGSKFTKGKIEVVPNPSLFYLPGQPVFVYYEVYNLKKERLRCSTKYRVSYELHSLQEGNISVRMLKALGRLVGVDRKAEVVTVEYAHEGGKADDYGYLELDMSNTEPGHQLLIVKVSDEIADSYATSAVSFAIR